MIKSILSAIPIYYISVYKISKKYASSIEGIFKTFIWKGANLEKRIHLINWDIACLPKDDGGVSLQSITKKNTTLGVKLVWRMYQHPEKLWCKVMNAKYLDTTDLNRILIVENSPSGSVFWNFLWECRFVLTEHLTW